MNRIDTPGSVAGKFRFGNPFAKPTPIPSTILGATWLNGIQEEWLYVIEQAGITPDKLDNTQLRAAILLEITALLQSGAGITDLFDSAPYAGSAGDGVLVVDTFGVATAAFTLGNPVTLRLTGEFTLPKKTGIGEGFTEGQSAFWNDAAREIQNDDVGTVHLVGYATADAAELFPTLALRLNGITRGAV